MLGGIVASGLIRSEGLIVNWRLSFVRLCVIGKGSFQRVHDRSYSLHSLSNLHSRPLLMGWPNVTQGIVCERKNSLFESVEQIFPL